MPDLPILLSRALGRIASGAAAIDSPAAPSLAVYANVIRCVAAGPIAERDLPTAARVSKRLATTAVNGAANAGWICVDGEKQHRTIGLTGEGESAADDWRRRLERVERELSGTPLRSSLEQLVSGLVFELPHFPASYGAADPSAIGGPYVQQAKRAADVPAHGNDWRPVKRADGDTVSSLSITALLSQALMAFTIDYENRFPWPLASTANVLCHIASTPRPLLDLPRGHGITGNGKSLLERHMIVSVAAGAVSLTDRGEQVLAHHPSRLEATEAVWRERHGDDVVDALRYALREPAASGSDYSNHLIWSGL